MNKFYYAFIFFFMFSSSLFAQTGGVSIGKDGEAAQADAILELVSTSKGLLIPRMTSDQRTAIFDGKDQSAKGLLVFDTTQNAFFFWSGTAWQSVSSANARIVSGVPTIAGSPGEIVFDSSSSALYIYSGYTWVKATGGSSNDINLAPILNPNGVLYLGTQNSNAVEVDLSSLKGGITSVIHDKTLEGNGVLASPLKISEKGIESSHLADNSITNDKLADRAVTTNEIADYTVTYPKIQRASGQSRLLGSSAYTTVIGEVALGTGLSMSGSTLNATGIAAVGQDVSSSGTITVTNGTGAALTAMNLDLASNAVTSSHLVDGSVSGSKIANNAITPNKLGGITGNGTSGQVLTSDGAGGFVWNAASPGGMTSVWVDGTTITGDGALIPLSVNSLPWATVTGKPTTIAGYGITDAFSNPMTAKGDMIIGGTLGSPSSLTAGTIGQILTISSGGVPTWTDAAAGGITSVLVDGTTIIGDGASTALTVNSLPFSKLTSKPTTISGYGITDALSNPMTAAGDIIIGGASGSASRLAKGTTGQVLTVSAGGVPTWQTIAAGGITSVLVDGTTITGDGASTALTVNSLPFSKLTSKPTTISGYGITDALSNPMTAAGDIIIGGASGSASRLAKGTDGQVLTLASGTPTWQTIAAGGGSVTSVSASGGTTGLTFSGGPITSSGTLTLGGTLAIANGGTGATTAGAALSNLGAQAADTDLTALAGLGTNGIIARTGSGTVATRTITQGTGISVTNGDGVSGNPTIALASTAVTAGSYTSANITVDAYGRITNATNGSGGGGGLSSVLVDGTTITGDGASTALAVNSLPWSKLTSKPTTISGYGITDALSNPMTTAGDIIIGGASGTATRLPKGTDGYVLTLASGTPTWAASSAGTTTLTGAVTGSGTGSFATTLSNNVVGTANITDGTITGADIATQTVLPTNLKGIAGNGTSGQVLTSNGSGSFAWAAASGGMTNPMTAAGDIIIGGASGAPTSLAKGTDGQVLTLASGTPTWQTIAAGGGSVTSVSASGGTTGLTFSGGPITSSGTLTLGGTLAIANGGTGATTAGAALTNLGAQATDTDLTALAGLGTTGIIARTGSGTVATRTITAGTGISVANGDGVSGNPTVTLANTAVGAGSYTNANITVDAQGRITSATNGSAGLTNPMTTAGDMIIGGASGTATRLPKGTDGQVLTLASGTPTWTTASSGTTTLTGAVTGSGTGTFATTLSNNVVGTANITDGTITGADIATQTIAGANIANQTILATNLKGIAGNGTSGQVLTSNGTGGFAWAAAGSGGATNLSYTASATDGTVSSDTGSDATIPGATTTTAGLMLATDKTKLNNIQNFTGSATDAGKVLTMNGTGTAATWTAPAASGGGGVKYQQLTFGSAVAEKFYALAKGYGDLESITIRVADDLAVDVLGFYITIPTGTTLEHLQIIMPYTATAHLTKFNDTGLIIQIKDTDKKFNNSLMDLMTPTFGIFALYKGVPDNAGGNMFYQNAGQVVRTDFIGHGAGNEGVGNFMFTIQTWAGMVGGNGDGFSLTIKF